MAQRKGRAVSAREKPIYEQCTTLFYEGRLHAFWAFAPDEWAVQHGPAHPVLPCTLVEVKNLLRRIDPGRCTWDKGRDDKPVKPNRAQILTLARKLFAALVVGDCDETLVAEAEALFDAA